uniref:Uncharacterized protein n=1 Tax=Gossypium raimondii TaxID=29730 RepID=A0A0D2P430_GOSRA|nr:hypothetical protein B456_004G045800 [Gossypium raimondii]
MGLLDSLLNWLRSLFFKQEMELSLVGLQNAGKTSLVNSIAVSNIYVVDAADRDGVPISRTELHDLLTKPSLSGIPLLVLGNKIDKSEALSKQALVDQLGLESISDREVCCYMISCKDSVNIDVVIDWLIKHSRSAK